MSRYKIDANDILVKVQKYYALQRRCPGLSPVTKLSRGRGKSKTCDKPINFIVRVSCWCVCSGLLKGTESLSSLNE